MKIITAEQMRELERRADAMGNSYAAMMERAGTLTAQAMMDRWTLRDKRVLVLVGPGNNGGDGLVTARVLHDGSANVRLYVWKRAADETDVNWKLCMERNIPVLRAEEDADFALLKDKVQHADFIVDALLGTGVSRPIEGTLEELLNAVRYGLERIPSPSALVYPDGLTNDDGVEPNSRRKTNQKHRAIVIAVDLSTGLNPDTGALDPATVAADTTVTFALPKVGQYAFPGAEAVGKLVVADIGIPTEWAQDVPLAVATADEIRVQLPERKRDSNKGTFGKVMLACGSSNFIGAPVLAARAAGRAGAGLVTLAVPQTIQAVISSKIDEATFLPLPDRAGDWRPRAANELLATLWDASYDALVVGCGLGRAEGTGEFLQRLLENLPTLEAPPALVLDADALNWLAQVPEWWTRFEFPTPPILTPHPGEMARLLDSDTGEVQKNRVGAARSAAREWNAIVVLKGAFTVVAAPDGQVTLLPFATPALATAGTGDVLAGTIGGMLAQLHATADDERSLGDARDRLRTKDEGQDTDGDAEPADVQRERAERDSYQAAVVGGFVHGMAGEMAEKEIGEAGVVAGDLVGLLPRVMRRLRRGESVGGVG